MFVLPWCFGWLNTIYSWSREANIISIGIDSIGWCICRERQLEGVTKAKVEWRYMGRKSTAQTKSDLVLGVICQGLTKKAVACLWARDWSGKCLSHIEELVNLSEQPFCHVTCASKTDRIVMLNYQYSGRIWLSILQQNLIMLISGCAICPPVRLFCFGYGVATASHFIIFQFTDLDISSTLCQSEVCYQRTREDKFLPREL